jgi:hypothetical protein
MTFNTVARLRPSRSKHSGREIKALSAEEIDRFLSARCR